MSANSFRRRRAHLPIGHDDPQLRVGAIGVALALDLVGLLPRLRCGIVTVLLNPVVIASAKLD
jgi:hypothetical protein